MAQRRLLNPKNEVCRRKIGLSRNGAEKVTNRIASVTFPEACLGEETDEYQF